MRISSLRNHIWEKVPKKCQTKSKEGHEQKVQIKGKGRIPMMCRIEVPWTLLVMPRVIVSLVSQMRKCLSKVVPQKDCTKIDIVITNRDQEPL